MSLIILRESANTDRMHVSFTNQDFEILVTGYSKSLDMSPLDSDVVLEARPWPRAKFLWPWPWPRDLWPWP